MQPTCSTTAFTSSSLPASARTACERPNLGMGRIEVGLASAGEVHLGAFCGERLRDRHPMPLAPPITSATLSSSRVTAEL